MLESEIEEGMRVEFRKIRENNLLIFGVLIGIIGGLLAGVINDLIRGSALYPWIYLLILITILLILIFVLLAPYFDWKRFEHGLDKRMKEIKNVLSMTEQHYAKHPKTSKPSSSPQNSTIHLHQ